MKIEDQRENESWRAYTRRLAKLNQTSRRSMLGWLRRHR
jgi:hypothetical protein